ncbi:MAG: IclR family transcriptional regulator [Hungatella sp.]|jgi:DNA-binding IclR family transcriptional regulator|nr:IclR family transcriptional regulator [Hungatella sp.]MCI9638140.1 IclR family transcriptional regulator [Hungatella sp.]
MKLNRTTQRTVEILKLVSKNPEGITLDDICEQLSLPKTSAYDIITTLVEMGMANVQKGQKQTYTIGLTAYRIGINYTNNLDFLGVIEPELKAFSREVGKTVFFGVRSDHEVVYICKFEPENPIITTATVGTKNPMYCTSLGKAILAYTDEGTRQQVTSRITFRRKTDNTIMTLEALERELDRVKSQGYALDAREMEDHMECAGAPVFGPDNSVMGAISVSSLYKPGEDYEALGRLVSKKAEEVSRLLGFLGKIN